MFNFEIARETLSALMTGKYTYLSGRQLSDSRIFVLVCKNFMQVVYQVSGRLK